MCKNLIYDELNNITSSTQNSHTITKEYDNNSNLVKLNADSFEIVNEYNTLNTLSKISIDSNEVSSLTYNDDEMLVNVVNANGISLDIELDSRDRESKREYSNNSNPIYILKVQPMT